VVRAVDAATGRPLVDELAGRVRRLVGELDADRSVLEVDYGAVDQQEAALWLAVLALRRYAYFAGRLDELSSAWIDSVAASDPQLARALRTGALTSIRRRRLDLLAQLAVATQGVAALRLIEQDHIEVIWALRAATTTTVTALNTAVLASRSVAADASGGPNLSSAAIDDVRETLNEMEEALDEVDRRRRVTLEAVRSRST
jgi:uncharacterized protein YaaN involved in tellurite resistance